MIKTLRPILVPSACPCGSSSKQSQNKFKGVQSSKDGCVLLDYGLKAKVAAERDIDLNAKLLQNNSTTKKTKKSAVAWLKSASSSSSSSNSSPNTMDLLQLLAINALEFTAPASAAFFLQPPSSSSVTSSNSSTAPSSTNSSSSCSSSCSSEGKSSEDSATQQQQHINNHHISNRRPFVQLSGHPGCFAPAGPSTLWKKQADGSYETKVYEYLSNSDDPMASIIPTFHSRTEWNGETFLEIEDLLTGFDHNPHVMDLKIGLRTFLESEVTNSSERSDLYQKMVKVDPLAPTEKEHIAKAVTKLRYMQFREEQSSTSSLGFRIEAIKFPNSIEPMSDLKTVKTESQVRNIMSKFLPTDPTLRSDLIERLKIIRTKLENSQFFKNHEVIGSSVLIIYDSHRVGAWIIDFAKTVQRPVSISHRKFWQMGNHEDGYLIGLDNLIRIASGAS
ncbi:unnamed protein product [Allacma fusca]|uniref:Kinase n=1 Tax=Allacma fusca TaxID=39272 RepID=A0A8J2LTD4_9HEXA|nr:unnamed protein product [Allacma fusca]